MCLLRFGKKVFSPLVSLAAADYLVCFHKAEHPRLKKFLKPGGTDLVGYFDKAQSVLQNPRYLNTFLVGVLAAYLPITEKNWIMALEKVFPEKIAKQNKEVFFKGRGLAKL